ncbi:mannose-1-phosphate guanylyltransferase/mannose-6-phosphate isomerase [Thalassotalea piscium]
MSVIPVILSGGSGTRLWPLSRKQYPKQLLNLTGGQYTMLQETLKRVSHLSSPIIVCNKDHRFMVAEQSNSIGVTPHAIILEPVARNTAPAIALAAYQALAHDKDAIIAVFPADHVITEKEAFKKTLEIAINEAKDNKLVTFGIVANKPETGFGYIKADKSKSALAYKVESFVEKPDISTAKAYIDSGDYFWNSGMFVFKASVYLQVLEQSNAKINKACKAALASAKVDLDFIRVDKASFEQSPDDSIDYAVMEQSNNVSVVPMDAGWSDLGSWSALWEILDKDNSENAFVGDVISINSNNNLVHSPKKLVATIGLENLVIVDTDDALLIANKDQVQEVKKVVEQLKNHKRDEHNQHREVHRPWGCYDSIDNGERYQVKRITVKPGASLSLQMHHHRAEHWVVVCGVALVQIGENKQLITENQSVYIPIGVKHRLTNPEEYPLEIIEVQTGSYLNEDDIVRFEDCYNRA